MENFSNYEKHKYSGFISFVLFVFLPSIYILATTELSFDETYYWIYSQYPSFGYFDHPPMVGLGIWIGTFLFGDNEFGVRVMSFISLLGAILMLKKSTNASWTDNCFWVLLLIFPLINLSAVFALPDSYMMFFGAFFFYSLKEYIEKNSRLSVLYVALSISGMFYAKYHGLLIVLLTVVALPHLLRRKSFYYIVCLVLVFYFPHIIWQYENDFVSFKFHLFGRAEKHFEFKNILDFLVGQLVLMGFSLFIYSCVKFKKIFSQDDYSRALIFNSFGFLLFLFFLSFRNQIEANWSLTCAISFFIILYEPFKRNVKKLIALGTFNILLNIGFKLLLIFLPFFASLDIKDNRFNEAYGWKTKRIPKILKLCRDKTIVGDNYQITSKLAFYTKNPTIPAMHFNSRSSHYEILNLEKNLKRETPICYLSSKNLKGSIRVETKYKDPVYVVPDITFSDLLLRYKVSYEEVIRD